MIIGATVLGILLFAIILLGVVIGGALAHKEGREAAYRTARDLAERKGGDVTTSGYRYPQGSDRGEPHVPA